MIDPSEISVVVQGPVAGGSSDPPGERLTAWCLDSIREHLPGAEVILTTWEGSDLSGLSYDRVVENVDPGPINCTLDQSQGPQVFDNTNRQLLSTRAGLALASRPYAVKVRSDMIFEGRGFLDYFGRYRARADAWRVLGERVVSSTHYARNPHSQYKYPFHPSDWFFFGRTEDVVAIWDVPLPPQPETARWFDTHSLDAAAQYFEPPTVHRYSVEQYVWTTFLRQHGPVPFAHRADATPEAIALSELTIANNLVLVDPEHLQVRFVKYSVGARDLASLYTEADWLALYRTYAGPAAAADADSGPIGRARPTARVMPERVSVVVQGVGDPMAGADVRRQTLRTLRSIRRHLPGAEIVLATTRGDAAADLPHDVLVEVDDPGALPAEGGAVASDWSGVNRRIVGTLAALRAASRPFAVDLRPDVVLTGAEFLDYARRYRTYSQRRRLPEWRLVRERVVVPTTFSRNPRRHPAVPYHPADWFHFGRRDDLLALWDVPLAPAGAPARRGLTVEQFLWTSFAGKYGDYARHHAFGAGPEALAASELMFANNLVIVSPSALGVRWAGRRVSAADWLSFYTHAEWGQLYRWWIDEDYRSSTDASDWVKSAHRVFTSPLRRLSSRWRAPPE